MALSERVKAWAGLGAAEEFRGRSIHVTTRDGEGPLLVLLHGFPTSSYDWREIFDLTPGRATLTFDFLGFGLSDKPHDHIYGLAWQADLTEELVARHGEGRPVFICAHDMGTSVATELFARDIAGELGFEVAGALLFNGSMILELASPTLAQKMLRSRLGPVAARLSSERFFRAQFASIFSPEHPLTDAEEEDQWSLITHGGGHRLGHRLVRYMDEREIYAERWHGAIRDWPGGLDFAWGMLDPVANTAVLDGLRELRPAARVTEYPDLGHYPQIEDPKRLTATLETAVGASRSS
ncbi:MAG: alpha/beta fold hydrolase [Solirubrobacterales bacterium]